MNLHKMAEKMAFFLVRKEIVKEEKVEIYSFGLEILFATVINGVLVTIAALLLGVFWKTVLMLVPFMLIRGNAGGFHAKSHLGCMVGFVVVYVAGIFAVKCLSEGTACTTAFAGLLLSAAVIMIIGALPHENRPVTERELRGFHRIARLLAVILLLIGVAGLHFHTRLFTYYSLGLCIAAGSLLAGCIKIMWERRKKS